MNRPLAGQVAVVTGASLGVGRAAALALAQAGADLVICARGHEIVAVAREAKALGARVLARRCDIADRAAVRSWLRAAARQFGRLDVLVNNAAALGPRVAISHLPAAEFTRVMNVNVGGVLHATQATLEFSMLKRRAGIIINISSGVGRVGSAGGSAYAISKFAVEGFTQVAAAELRETGISVCSLNPGVTRTRMRAAWAPGEDPMTLKPPESLGQHFIALAASAAACAGRCYGVTSAGALVELEPPSGRPI